MQLTLRTIGWALGAAVLAIGSFVLGTFEGAKYERDRFAFSKDAAPALADEYLAKGEVDKAIRALHFTKSFERRTGLTDAALGYAYLAKGQPCLAQAFLESALEWMTIEKFTDEIHSYASAKEALPNVSTQCSQFRARSIGPK